MTGFKKVRDDALRRITEMLKRAILLKEEDFTLNFRLRIIKKTCEAAFSSFDGRLREMRTLGARVRMSCDELDSLRCCDPTNCSLEVTTCKVPEAQGNIINQVRGFHLGTVSM